ncbi:uncharacterized protein LOC5518875 [Nematostella vectensis]|uniref:uncharacterized protein LOC5518875 n=1 Tax=Nematostella vectensis TaxID=45351 RepID=UPI0020777338|nr:uncharacterized protein LOC5518875 [Nematostella vectensis]
MNGEALALFCLLTLNICSRYGVHTQGTHFIVGFIGSPSTNALNDAVMQIYIINAKNVTSRVLLRYYDEGKLITEKHEVEYNKRKIIDFQATRYIDHLKGTDRKGISIASDEPVSVYGLDRNYNVSGDFLLALPIIIGKPRYFYIVAGYYPETGGYSKLSVIAFGGKTNVSIKVKSTGYVFYGGLRISTDKEFVKTLDEMEAMSLYSNDGDFTGTEITANGPVSVYSGVMRYEQNSQYCTSLMSSQIPEVNDWGREFLLTPMRSYHYSLRIIAGFDNTVVTMGNSSGIVLDRGGFTEQRVPPGDGLSSVLCKQPCLVVKYTIYDSCYPISSHRIGKRFMMLVPPTSRYSSVVIFPAPEPISKYYKGELQYVSAVVKSIFVDGMRYNGRNLRSSSSWRSDQESEYSMWHLSLLLDSGSALSLYHIDPNVTFYVSTYYYGNAMCHGFPFGWNICPSKSQTQMDGIDNDCDGQIDEEVLNGIDDDGDGLVDEDVSAPPPSLTLPRNDTLETCSQSEIAKRLGEATGQPGNPNCSKKGGPAVISYSDTVLKTHGCTTTLRRTWTITDGCRNSVEKSQLITFSSPKPNITFPGNVTLSCSYSIDSSSTGRPLKLVNRCGNVLREHFEDVLVGQSRCPSETQVIHRRFVIAEDCGRSWTHVQKIVFEPERSLTESLKKRVTGVGAGLGVFLAVAIVIIVILLCFLKRRQQSPPPEPVPKPKSLDPSPQSLDPRTQSLNVSYQGLVFKNKDTDGAVGASSSHSYDEHRMDPLDKESGGDGEPGHEKQNDLLYENTEFQQVYANDLSNQDIWDHSSIEMDKNYNSIYEIQ